MRSLPTPSTTCREVIELCAKSVRATDLKNRLSQAEPMISAAEKEYRIRGEIASLFSTPKTSSVGRFLTGKEMERVYNNTFVKSSKTRHIYSQLKKNCVNDICPLCGQGTVRQLDHYLPITEFPTYGITPLNLIPACSDCNKFKLAYHPKTAEDQTLHPYFDNLDKDQWLIGTVVESHPASIRFIVKPPAFWDTITTSRVTNHFNIFKLGALYGTHAAVEMNNMRFVLKQMESCNDSAKVISEYLRNRAESCAQVNQNSWQRATYEALSNSQWFCSGGFNYR
jgi:hypothetical protein